MEPVELDTAFTHDKAHIGHEIISIGLSPFINFKQACNYELEFLKKIDLRRDIYYNAEFVEISIQRYEKYWLPLLASLSTDEHFFDYSSSASNPNKKAEYGSKMKYAPPTDIHWVWHVHMLAPASYIKDCKVHTDNVILISWLLHI